MRHTSHCIIIWNHMTYITVSYYNSCHDLYYTCLHLCQPWKNAELFIYSEKIVRWRLNIFPDENMLHTNRSTLWLQTKLINNAFICNSLYRFETNKVSVPGEYNMWKTASHMRETVVKSNCATHHEKFCV